MKTLRAGAVVDLSSGIAAKGLGFCNQVGSVWLLTRAMGAAGLEAQIVALSYVGWFALSIYGLYTTVPALIVRNRADSGKVANIIGSVFAISLTGACVTSAIAVTAHVGAGFGPSMYPILPAIACNALLLFLSPAEQMFQASGHILRFNLLNIVGASASLFATYIVMVTRGGSTQFILAYYVSPTLPVLVATLVIFARYGRRAVPTPRVVSENVRPLLIQGVHGLGYGISLYCKQHLPILLLQGFGYGLAVAEVGLGLRLAVMLFSGLAIFFPIILVRTANAITDRNFAAYRQWVMRTLWLCLLIAVGVIVLIMVAGTQLFDVWTNGRVPLSASGQIALSAFTAALSIQYMLLAVIAPDPETSRKLRWLFWVEAVIAPTCGLLGAYWLGGAGMLAGLATAMSAVIVIELVMISRSIALTREAWAEA